MYTPLHAACASGQLSVVRLLLDYGVEVDAVSAQGNTSLHVACLNGQDMVASELISHGASIDSRNHKGQVTLFTYVINCYHLSNSDFLHCYTGLVISLISGFK